MKYDLVIVGGGLAGAALASAMARHRFRVLVLERSRQFRDRIRGEGMHPWGAFELQSLGLSEALTRSGAHFPRFWTTYLGSNITRRRDLCETTPHRTTAVNFYHPTMQEAMLVEAESAGAEVRRGVSVVHIVRESPPTVTAIDNGRQYNFTARIVVGADGRQSAVRRDGGFTVRRDPDSLRITRALFEGVDAPADSVHVFVAPAFGHASLLFPIGNGRFRVYFTTGRRAEHRALTGNDDCADLLAYCASSGVPAEWLARARLCGPLGTFEGADVWVDHPYHDGIALVGDAAAANDPCFGCGLSLMLRDVRVLRDELIATEDWNGACERYALTHDRHYGSVHTVTSWLRAIRYDLGPAADRRREHAMNSFAAGTAPDLIAMGPECPADEQARVAFLGR